MREQWWRVAPRAHRHWWRVGSRATAGTPKQQGVSHGFPSPAVRITVTCKRRKTHKAVGFNFFLLVFGSVSLFLRLGRSVRFFFFPNLLCFRWLPASSPLPLCIGDGSFSDLFHLHSPLLSVHLISVSGWRRELSVWVAAKAGV